MPTDLSQADDQTLRAAAERAIAERNWPAAAEALAKVASPDAPVRLQLNLVRNFACFQQHRPAVYDALVAARGDPRFQLVASASGMPTIHFSDQPGRSNSLSIDNDPLKGVAAMFGRLRGDLDKGAPLALCGLGDGYLLGALAQRPPKLFLTMQHCVHVIEPLPQVLLLCMMIHDYSADTGPIVQPRFRWHVGDAWQAQLQADLLGGDLFTPFPMVNVSQGINVGAITTALTGIREQLLADDTQRARELADYYAGISREQWVNLFGSFPDRTPRVMLLTTRFSTVLQYSTRDAAQAFGQLGWETFISIEPNDWQLNSGCSVRKQLHDFRPDLVFQIDHLRSEHGNLYPPQLPFACWVQDHLPNLCNPTAGAKVGVRDYVLTGIGSLFEQQHAYPRRQIIDLPQLSRVPMRPTEWASDGDDLVYVSNWSRPPEAMVAELLKRFADPPVLRPLVDKCCGVVCDLYAGGDDLATHHGLRLVLDECQKATGVTITDPALKHTVVDVIFDRLNNALYRHQAIGWAMELAQERGLTLGLYGHGWDQNPRFAAHARGPVTPGEAMERLTRASKINLQLEPFACFSHARLLSGLFAGGFFLIRDNPFNHLTQELLNFVDRVFPADVCTVEHARRVVKDHHRERLESLLARCACLGEQMDPIGLVRDWQRAGVLIPQGSSLPRLNDVLFRDKASLAAAVDRYIDNPQLRYEISTEQRQNTQSRLSYKAGLERVTRAITKLIATEPAVEKAKAA